MNSSDWKMILAGAGLLTAAGLTGYAAMKDIERYAQQAQAKKEAFLQRVALRLTELETLFNQETDDSKKSLIRDEIARLVSHVNEEHFDALNRLFDQMLSSNIVDVVRATEERRRILEKPAPAAPQRPQTTRESVYKEIDRVNARINDFWVSDAEKEKLIELRNALYDKLT